MRQNAHLTHSHYNSSPFPSLFHWTLIKMMYVRAWNPFHLPPVYHLLVWQMSANAMMISLFTKKKKITYLWSRDMTWNGEEDEEKKMFRVFLSPGPDVLALLSFSLQRKHTLIQTIGEICKCQNIALACFVTVCLVLDCQNWVRLPLKIYSKASHWRFETMWHNRVCNLVNAAK